MRKRFLSLSVSFSVVLLITYLLLDKESHIASNITILIAVMTVFILGQYWYLEKNWFRHLDELPSLMNEVQKEEQVKVSELSKEPDIINLQYGIEKVSKHIEKMSRKYGYRKGQLEAMLGSLKLGIVAVRQDGSIIFCNPKFNEIYNLGQNIQGKSIYENIFDKDLLEVLDKSLSSEIFKRPNVVQSNGLVFNYRGLEMKSGAERIGTLLVIEDVTKVYQVDKMKSDFVSNVTHELKTPLTSIKGFTETLQQVDPNDIETRDKFLKIIETESDRLFLLINDILYLSEVESIETIDKVDVDVNRICSEVVELSKPNLGEEVELSFVAEKHFIVQFEQHKLKQLLLNLVSNSVKYTDTGYIRIELSADTSYVILKVIDTGIGIPKEDQGRIFERFYRVDKGRSRKTGGTGLGLSIVKHIAERNDCQILLESDIDEGTTVTVLIKK